MVGPNVMFAFKKKTIKGDGHFKICSFKNNFE